jgi:hypothetical protein
MTGSEAATPPFPLLAVPIARLDHVPGTQGKLVEALTLFESLSLALPQFTGAPLNKTQTWTRISSWMRPHELEPSTVT